ncbi:MAG: Alpha/Beta hydrolase protein [Benjaminiella poitrasii]|nr:MAG: Alpha/Beta hydrolase protein [Benjaminiella poitrasii]
MKRSKLHERFPEYSLRYTHPTICKTASKQTSGYFELPDGKNFFFWFFESLSSPSTDPLVLWINGGPGCSSMLGLLMGTGPCHVNEDSTKLISNPHSWTNKANIIYLDQPVNAGYSFNSNHSYHVVESNSAAVDVYIFLQLFLREFSQFAESDFHLAGESYAGHYLPAIATIITEENAKEESHLIPLKSLLIGNGLTDPLTQYQYYKSMACTPSSHGVTLVSSFEKCQELESHQTECQNLIQACYKQTNFTHPQDSNEICKAATGVCNKILVNPIIATSKQLNIYDIRRPCEDGILCYDYLSDIKTYLDRPETKSALGVNASSIGSFEICSGTVNADFQSTGDWMRPYVQQLTALLNQHIRILAYAGDADFLCNWMGIRAWTLQLLWYGQREYQNQQDNPWHSKRTPSAGLLRKHNELAFLRIFDAGHMAPYDQPEIGLEMFTRWISNDL